VFLFRIEPELLLMMLDVDDFDLGITELSDVSSSLDVFGN